MATVSYFPRFLSANNRGITLPNLTWHTMSPCPPYPGSVQLESSFSLQFLSALFLFNSSLLFLSPKFNFSLMIRNLLFNVLTKWKWKDHHLCRLLKKIGKYVMFVSLHLLLLLKNTVITMVASPVSIAKPFSSIALKNNWCQKMDKSSINV